MKILTLGDTHGRPYWKEIISNDYDLIIFLGDYIDAYEFEDAQVLANLLDIIQYKIDNFDKVVLLWGNHDLQYLFSYNTHGCSGYRSNMYHQLHDIYNKNKQLFKVAYQIKNYLWTHAGVSEAWYNKFLQFVSPNLDGNLADKFTQTFNSSKEWVITQVGASRGGLRGDYGGPLWADASETQFSPKEGLIQIVGHTPQRKITTFGNYTYCDVLQHTKKGYILEL